MNPRTTRLRRLRRHAAKERCRNRDAFRFHNKHATRLAWAIADEVIARVNGFRASIDNVYLPPIPESLWARFSGPTQATLAKIVRPPLHKPNHGR